MEQKNKPSQAERAAGAKSRSGSIKKDNKKKEKNTTKPKKDVIAPEKEAVHIPSRLIGAMICAGLFLFFIVMLFQLDGLLPNFVYGLVVGLIGKTGFIFCIPVLLFLFVLLGFSGKKPVAMRCTNILLFLLIVGCISHLLVCADNTFSISDLYTGGEDGTTGGVICGLLGALLSKILSRILAFIVLLVLGALALMASFDITIPGLVRAFQNHAQDAHDDEDPDDKPEPSEIVVDRFLKMRDDMAQNRRKRREAAEAAAAEDKKNTTPKMDPQTSGMMRQIDVIEKPVTYSEGTAPVKAEVSPKQEFGVGDDFELIDFSSSNQPFSEEKITKSPSPTEDSSAVNVDIPLDPPLPEKVTAKEARESAAEVALEIAQANAVEKPMYCFPPINLLHPGKRGSGNGTAEMQENTRRLNETLASFKIEAHIINVTRGPSVTRYEVELEKGVRLNKLTTIADDIALSLGASGVRIAAVPDKISVVGIEVPNRSVTTVALREVIDSPEFSKAKSKSSFAVGKDIGGSCIVGNIAKLPHMLIAGTTGSGKSVCMNSIIISLLYKASPDDVKLIMVDPKMVELGIYNGIPHLLIPVVTDPKKAAGSLQWAVSEMMRRYKSMSDAGVRDLESYNSIMEAEEGTRLPQVVVIIDELADLMLVAAKEVEESICRIAQMGRAAGIHLIIATQRPSADVITGLMKANIPSRIAFSVASAMESRIILDTQGAEKLVGRGDMLFAPIGNGKPLRVQGCFVTDEEVEAVANYVKDNFITDYDQTVMEEIEKKAVQTGNKGTVSEPEPNSDELEGDEMLPAAVDVILETGQASVSMLQRRLKLGYARAARIVDEMEERGIVGPFKGSKPREILITKEQWAQMNGGAAETLQDIPFDDTDDDPLDFQ